MFKIETSATMTNMSVNSELAGEDAGRKAIVLDFKASITPKQAAPLFMGDPSVSIIETFFEDGKHLKFPGLGEMKIGTTHKDCCKVSVSTLETSIESEGVSASKFKLKPTVGGRFELKFQLYIPNASHQFLDHCYDWQGNVLDIVVEKTQGDLVGQKEAA